MKKIIIFFITALIIQAFFFRGAAQSTSKYNNPNYEDTLNKPNLSWEDIVKSKNVWDEVKISNDIEIYANYFDHNPDTEHIDELKTLVDNFLKSIIANALKNGCTIYQNQSILKGLKLNLHDFTSLGINGGKVEGRNVIFYSDPTDILYFDTMQYMKYLRGKGIVIYNKNIFTYGL
jgi:hypothetical protein